MLKRIFDLIGAVTLIIIFSPVLCCAAFIILIRDGYPVFFRQKRLGRETQEFRIIKFRTMAVGESAGEADDERRITNLGQFLRKFSLDELPLLFNVVRGDMSLVGPRPLLLKYKNRFNEFQNRRHEVLPGITGLAQIKGRNTLSWSEKFKFDVDYVDNHSFLGDLKILIITLFQVLKGKGVTPEDQGIMPEFKGSEINESAE